MVLPAVQRLGPMLEEQLSRHVGHEDVPALEDRDN